MCFVKQNFRSTLIFLVKEGIFFLEEEYYVNTKVLLLLWTLMTFIPININIKILKYLSFCQTRTFLNKRSKVAELW